MLPVSALARMGGKTGRRISIAAMKKDTNEKMKSGKKQNVRGAVLKIIPDAVAVE